MLLPPPGENMFLLKYRDNKDTSKGWCGGVNDSRYKGLKTLAMAQEAFQKYFSDLGYPRCEISIDQAQHCQVIFWGISSHNV